jgi:uncharacterized protein (TIGR02453 family)
MTVMENFQRAQIFNQQDLIFNFWFCSFFQYEQLMEYTVAAKVFDLEVYPSFEGFPTECIDFFKKLKRNNNREWFIAHKEEFETFVKLPMYSLIESLKPHFSRFAPEFDCSPKRAMFRIYRDIRFSNDKTPYKTHVAAQFSIRGDPRGVSGPGYYVHIEPGEIFVGAGCYMPDSDQLRKIRRAIDQQRKEFLAIIGDKSFKKRFGQLDGDRSKRIPQGFDAGDPMAEWLKLKQFLVSVTLPESKCERKAFVGDVAAIFEEASPLVNFIVNGLR